MADINVTRPHNFTDEEATGIMQDLADGLVSKHGGSYQWSGDDLNYKTTGVKAKVSRTDSEVNVRVDLGLLMKALSPMLKKEIESYLDKLLA